MVDMGAYCPIDMMIPFEIPNGYPDFNTIPHYWRRVAGAHYCRKAYNTYFKIGQTPVSTRRASVRFAAIPEPSNEWDPCAVRLDLNGIKAGYVNATSAPRLYSIAKYWEMQGKVTYLPGQIWFDLSELEKGYDLNSWVALPTDQELCNHIPVDKIVEEMLSWWKEAPSDICDELKRSWFHMTPKIRRHMVRKRDLLPDVPIHGPADGRAPLVVEWALREIRLADQEERARKRLERRRNRNGQIVHLLMQGLNFRETAERLKLSPGTVSKVAKEYGYAPAKRKPDVLRILNVSTQALELQKSGLSVAKVAETLGVSLGTAEKYLADARFYFSPELYVGRFVCAYQYHAGLVENGAELSDDKRRRARIDAYVLAHLGRLH